jgi:hypothetical protein
MNAGTGTNEDLADSIGPRRAARGFEPSRLGRFFSDSSNRRPSCHPALETPPALPPPAAAVLPLPPEYPGAIVATMGPLGFCSRGTLPTFTGA